MLRKRNNMATVFDLLIKRKIMDTVFNMLIKRNNMATVSRYKYTEESTWRQYSIHAYKEEYYG